MQKVMLSTIDNPFNPFTDFTSWLQFDLEKGHDSCGLLGRIARTADSLSEAENDDEIERAIDEIVKYDFLNIFIKVKDNRPAHLKALDS